MKRILVMLVITVVLVGTAWVGVVAGTQDAQTKVDDPRFQFLASLEGTWSEAGSEGRANGDYRFHVTAGGTAIEEREMIGTPMEMLTVYHVEESELIGTHYCMLGNQPRVIAAAKFNGKSLSFACDGNPGSTKSHSDQHIHGWSMRLAGDGRLHVSATMFEDGEVTKTPNVVLTRQQTTASR